MCFTHAAMYELQIKDTQMRERDALLSLLDL